MRGFCGFIDERESFVTVVPLVENVANNPTTRFAIDPDELYENFKVLGPTGKEVVDVYRAHPNGPRSNENGY